MKNCSEVFIILIQIYGALRRQCSQSKMLCKQGTAAPLTMLLLVYDPY